MKVAVGFGRIDSNFEMCSTCAKCCPIVLRYLLQRNHLWKKESIDGMDLIVVLFTEIAIATCPPLPSFQRPPLYQSEAINI